MKDGALEPRYTVTHKYGEPIPEERRFFVLSPDTDIIAWEVLLLYADHIRPTHPMLAESIVREFLSPPNKKPKERDE